MKKMTEKMDKAMDRKAGVKEGAARDMVMDKRGGVVPMKKAIRKAKK